MIGWPSRYSQGEALGLLQREDVVPYQISNGPEDDNPKERNEAGTVVHYRGEGYQRYPIENIVCHKDQVAWVSEPQFGWTLAAQVLPLPG